MRSSKPKNFELFGDWARKHRAQLLVDERVQQVYRRMSRLLHRNGEWSGDLRRFRYGRAMLWLVEPRVRAK